MQSHYALFIPELLAMFIVSSFAYFLHKHYNPFVPNESFLYSRKTSENCKVF